MTRRVHYSAWGRGLDQIELPAYAVQQDGEGVIEAVYRAIARRNRLHVCAGPRIGGAPQGSTEQHGEATLGERCPSGGYTPVAEVWICAEVSR